MPLPSSSATLPATILFLLSLPSCLSSSTSTTTTLEYEQQPPTTSTHSPTLPRTYLPDELHFAFTIRSFLPMTCLRRNETDVFWPVRERCDNGKKFSLNTCSVYTYASTCPLPDERRMGTVRGHPDFQISFPGNTWKDDGGNFIWTPGQGTSGIGRPFQSHPYDVSMRRKVENTKRISQIVADDLILDPKTGIYKMQFCSRDNRFLCGVPYEYIDPTWTSWARWKRYSPLAATAGADAFDSWYRDDAQVNRRVGVALEFQQSQDGSIRYNSRDDTSQDGRFFPLDQFIDTPYTFPLTPEEMAPDDVNDADRAGGGGHKFWFTTEMHSFFEYTGGEVLKFSGDDDFWAFINGRLAVDLGGMHDAYSSYVRLDDAAAFLNITRGNVYAISLFHAERRIRESNFKITMTLAKGCNVLRSGTASFAWASDTTFGGDSDFNSHTGFKLVGAAFAPRTGVLEMARVPNSASYAWRTLGQNVGQGFVTEFDFTAWGLGPEGLAMAIHRDEIVNVNGGSGGNFGIRGLKNSVAIVFDFCMDRRHHRCNEQSVSIYASHSGDAPLRMGTTPAEVSANAVTSNWRDGIKHKVRIAYYARPNWLEVYVDNSLWLVWRNFDSQQILGGRSAMVGLTSSTGNVLPVLSGNVGGGIDVTRWTLKSVRIAVENTKLIETANFTVSSSSNSSNNNNASNVATDTGNVTTAQVPMLVADGRATKAFTIQTYDLCGYRIQYGGFGDLVYGELIEELNNSSSPAARRLMSSEYETHDQLDAQVLNPCNASGPYWCGAQHPTRIPAAVRDHGNGSYDLVFSTTVVGTFSLWATFGCEGVVKNCWSVKRSNALRSIPATNPPTPARNPASDALPRLVITWDMVAIGAGVVGGIICCCLVAGLCLLRSRKRWRRDKKFIESGIIVKLEKDVEMYEDPELFRMADKVQRTSARILEWKSISETPVRDREVQHLSTTVKTLREQVTSLKRKLQEDDVDRVTSSRFVRGDDDGLQPKRREFSRSRAGPAGGNDNLQDNLADIMREASALPPPLPKSRAPTIPQSPPVAIRTGVTDDAAGMAVTFDTPTSPRGLPPPVPPRNSHVSLRSVLGTTSTTPVPAAAAAAADTTTSTATVQPTKASSNPLLDELKRRRDALQAVSSASPERAPLLAPSPTKTSATPPVDGASSPINSVRGRWPPPRGVPPS